MTNATALSEKKPPLKSPIFNSKPFIIILDYGEEDWRKLTTQNLDNVECYHDEVKKNFGATLDWYDILFIFQSFFLKSFFSIIFKFTCDKNLAEHLTIK